MKLSKKVTSVALASVLALSMAVAGFAAEGPSTQGGVTPTPTATATATPTATVAPTEAPAEAVKEVKSGSITAAVAKDLAATVTVKDKKLVIKKNALKGTKVKKIVAKNVTKASKFKIKGNKAGKNITIILSKKMSAADKKKCKDKAKKAGVKVKFK